MWPFGRFEISTDPIEKTVSISRKGASDLWSDGHAHSGLVVHYDRKTGYAACVTFENADKINGDAIAIAARQLRASPRTIARIVKKHRP